MLSGVLKQIVKLNACLSRKGIETLFLKPNHFHSLFTQKDTSSNSNIGSSCHRPIFGKVFCFINQIITFTHKTTQSKQAIKIKRKVQTVNSESSVFQFNVARS